MSSGPSLPARFQPLRPPSRRRRRVLLIVGPLLWVAALAVLAVVMRRSEALWYALAVLGVSFVVTLAILMSLRAARVRSERRA